MTHSPSNNQDTSQQAEDLAAFRREIRYDAKVKVIGTEADEFTVDIYADGLTKPATHLGVKAYSTLRGETHTVDEEIQVALYPSGFARIVASAAGVGTVVLRATANSNGGKYLGYLQRLKSGTNIVATGDLVLSSLYEDIPGSSQVLMLNPIEDGLTGNSLVLPNYFLGRKIQTNSDGLDVYMLTGALTFAC